MQINFLRLCFKSLKHRASSNMRRASNNRRTFSHLNQNKRHPLSATSQNAALIRNLAKLNVTELKLIYKH